MRHKHVWVLVRKIGKRYIYRCDVRRMRGNWQFCGEFGYGEGR